MCGLATAETVGGCMSRSGYDDDLDPLDLGRWRGQVASAIRGKRGQAFLKELLMALDAMPEKRLVQGEFESEGEVCALGCVARARGMDLSTFDPEDAEYVGGDLGIADQLAREIMWLNDESGYGRADKPEKRWADMREWVANQIKKPSGAA